MALYDLVTLRKALIENLNADDIIDDLLVLKTRIENIKLQVPVLPPEHTSYINQLIDTYEDIIAQTAKPVEEFNTHLSLINNQIEVITKNLFDNNYELEERYGTAEFVRGNRRIYANSEIEKAIKQRIQLYTDWHYPTLEIGCRDGEWTQFLVAADPLYIVDRHEEFLKSTTSRFPDQFQRRLRQYQLVDHNLLMLPVNQFGFVFSWGYFNYVSMATLERYLKQIFDLLRPGGTFMFSYNDGDTPSGAGMAENFAQTYVPKSMLEKTATNIGYTVTAEQKPAVNLSWIELKKPGELNTVKAHQVMGELKRVGS